MTSRHTTYPTKVVDFVYPPGYLGPGPHGWACSCGEKCGGFWSVPAAASAAQTHMVEAPR